MIIHKNGYWINNTSEGHYVDKYLLKELITLFSGKTVADLGCGIGYYVQNFLKNNILAEGYDGNPHTRRLSKNTCHVLDISKKINIDIFDWILCLEVGEHIPREYEDILIDNIHRHNRLGVVISWAIENQDGVGHINCRNNEYIKEIFKKLNYFNDIPLENKLRLNTFQPFFKNTIMVFKKII